MTSPNSVKVGSNALEFAVTDPAGKPVKGANLTSDVLMTSMDMGTTHPTAKETKEGHYASQVQFSMKGPWRVNVKVTPPGGKPFSRAFDFHVAK